MRVVGGTGRGRSAVSTWGVRALAGGLALSAVLAGCGPAPSGSASSSPTGFATASLTPSASATQPHGIFLPTGKMNALRGGYPGPLLAPLNDGRVLVVGGDYTETEPNAPATGETYDPTTGTWTKAGSLGGAIDCQTATALLNGRVLIAGCFLAGAEVNYLYDPGAGTFSRTGSLHHPRKAFTATLLNDGEVLIVGGLVPAGSSAPASWVSPAELFDPGTGQFSVTGSLHTGRQNASATRLSDGRVLIAGGDQGLGPHSKLIGASEIYDPASGAFSAGGTMRIPRTSHTATLLRNGEVLFVGGISINSDAEAVAELFDPRTGAYTTTGSLKTGRCEQGAVLLKNGRVLVVGGSSDDPLGPVAMAELYDPGDALFWSTGALREPRAGPAAALLPDGRVLVIGDDDTAELYWP